jgi:bifunctional non-homologous end joining protein LigD
MMAVVEPVDAQALWPAVSPMLASGPPDPAVPPAGPDWQFEVKWDGIRALARVDVDGRISLRSRTGNDLSARYPSITAASVGLAMAGSAGPAILDGECVAFDDEGRPSFPGVLRGGRAVRLMCFDALVWRGRDVRDLPLARRRDLLASVDLETLTHGAWRTSPVFTDGPALMAATADQGLEGVMAKDGRSPYLSGERSPAWVKLPHRTTAVVVVVGWVRSTSGRGVGSLVVADVDRRLVGAVGSGLSQRLADALGPVLAGISREAPDRRLVIGDRSAWLQGYGSRLHWALPALVAEVRYLGHTESGSMRQPVLVRMRPDLDVSDVLGEPW